MSEELPLCAAKWRMDLPSESSIPMEPGLRLSISLKVSAEVLLDQER